MHHVVSIASVAFSLAAPVAPTAQEAAPPDFHRDVLPLFERHCFECHGADEATREADFRMDSPEFAFADLGGETFVFKAGDVEASYALERILADDEFDVMPPPEHSVMADADKQVVKRWVEAGAPWPDAPAEDTVDFHAEIAPLLQTHCFECHGENEETREADFRMDTAEFALADLGGETFVFKAGDVEASYAYERAAATDEFDRMPPPEYGPGLNEAELARLKLWIEQGAVWPDAPEAGEAVPAAPAPVLAEPAVSFAADVLPILATHLYDRTGLDEDSSIDPFQLSLLDELFKEVDGATAVVPGDVEHSLLLAGAASSDDSPQAPVTLASAPSPEEAATLASWIRQGAAWNLPWSLTPPMRPAVPAVDSSWPAHSVDAFILEAMMAAGCEPLPEAERATLLRRGTFDLLGRPPTLEELDAFVNDAADDAWLRAIDRLLNHDEFAEHFARSWIDATSHSTLDDPAHASCSAALASALREGHGYQQTLVTLAETLNEGAVKDARKRGAALAALALGLNAPEPAHWTTAPFASVESDRLAQWLESHRQGSPQFDPAPQLVALEVPRQRFGAALLPAPEGTLTAWADSLVADDHPLTARVAADRLWRVLFEQSLVPDDFAADGAPPTHPALLDWLAVELRSSDWNLHALLRGLMTSSTYRQAARAEATGVERMHFVGASAHLLSAGPLTRQAAMITGVDHTTDIPPSAWPTADAALNLAQRLYKSERGTIRRLLLGFRLCTSREPTDHEMIVLTRLFQQQFNRYVHDAEDSRALLATGGAPVDPSIDAGELAAWTAISYVLLGLDEARREG